MASNRFAQLSRKGESVVEVVGVGEFYVTTTVIVGISRYSSLVFENGAEGYVWQINGDSMKVLIFQGELPPIGSLGADTTTSLSTLVSSDLLGRVVDPLLRPLDGKPEVVSQKRRNVFAAAPSFGQRELIDEQMITGITVVDTLLPIVKGQRIAVVGEAKSGKSSFLLQTAVNQAKLGSINVLVLIAKRWSDIRKQIDYLSKMGGLERSVVIVADISQPLPLSFIAPYIGAAIAESFWYAKHDTILMLDDLSNHAKIYREMSLKMGLPAGREAYPGDMFYIHSSLLERAGKLTGSGATQTILAIGTTPNADIATYLSTSLISMTDGQLVFDLQTMHGGRRPAINLDQSVSRVGGRIQSYRGQQLSHEIKLVLSRARSAEEIGHFGGASSEIVANQLELAKRVNEAFSQTLEQSFTATEQQILLSAILRSNVPQSINVPWLRTVIADVVKQPVKDEDIEAIASELINNSALEVNQDA
jgi:F-type H+-transporting ATPase subunit alpha